jgi:hypothetical protein
LLMRKRLPISLTLLLLAVGLSPSTFAQEQVLVPQIDGAFWQIAGDPDLGAYTSPKQQPVDFGVWQAADGTWQLWSCIRETLVPGNTRLFYRWQANNLTDTNWTPMGIAMMADPNFGEAEGGLQAPYVMKEGSDYTMFYGTWDHIAIAKSKDGKTFARQLTPEGKSGLFSQNDVTNMRDPMAIKIGKLYYLYYTAEPEHRGADYVRTSPDLVHWSPPTTVAFGGSQGNGEGSAECPFVYFHKQSGYYYLLRNQVYGKKAHFAVYRSKDPLNFGRGNDEKLVETLPYAAPEIIEFEGNTYLAVLLPNLKGIQIVKLKWVPNVGH